MSTMEPCLDELQKDSSRLRILVIGPTGVGKTTLVNNLLGKPVAEVEYFVDSTTNGIGCYKGEIQNVPVVIYDTSGLGDSNELQDEDYLTEIKKVISDVHVIIYCIKMTETRMHGGMIKAFQQYNKIGINWGKTMFALTFADAIIPPTRLKKQAGFNISEYFNERIQEWRLEVPQVLERDVHVDGEMLLDMNINPTTDDPDCELLNGDHWFTSFLSCLFELLTPDSIGSLDVQNENVGNEDGTESPSVPSDSDTPLLPAPNPISLPSVEKDLTASDHLLSSSSSQPRSTLPLVKSTEDVIYSSVNPCPCPCSCAIF